MRRILRQIYPAEYRACLWVIMISVTIGSMISLAVSVIASEGKRVAFVVGIGTYDNLPGKQLKNAINDAEGVSRKLAEIGFQVTKASNLTRQGFHMKWSEVFNSLTEEDTFVLFYSGHGVQIRQQNYLLPRDILPIDRQREDLLTTEAISLTALLNDLTQGRGDKPPPKRAVVIIDACRDNPFIPSGAKSIKTSSGLAKPSSTRGLFIIYSADENSISLDELPNDDKSVKYSVFTRALLPLLTRPIKLQDLSLELKKTVLSFTRNTRVEQRPTAYDGTDGEEFCLPGCAAGITTGRSGSEPVQSVPQQPKLNFKDIFSDSKLEAMIRPPQGLSAEKRPSHTGQETAPMVLIPGGSFMMGSTQEEVNLVSGCSNLDREKESVFYQIGCGAFDDEVPKHKVGIDAFYLDRYEVTNRLFEEFVRETGYRTTAEREGSANIAALWEFGKENEVKGATWRQPEGGQAFFVPTHQEHPVVSVSWDDAVAFCRWSGKRLPTEAEWEYAARAGTTTLFWWGDGNPDGRRVGNIAGGAIQTAPVGSYDANPWGLHDMIGNAAEWTADLYSRYGTNVTIHDQWKIDRGLRVIRGGSWFTKRFVHSAQRREEDPTNRTNDVGFRCAKNTN